MWSNSETSKETQRITLDESEFADFVPYLSMLCGVASRFTEDQSESERLVEQALLRAVEEQRTQTPHRPPKMVLLGALRESYLRSRVTVNA